MNLALRCRPRFPSWSLPGWLVVIAAVAASPCFAAGDADNPAAPPKPPTVEEPDEWTEQKVPLPPFPRAEHLLPLRHDEVDSGFLYYVDVTSVSRGADDVIRYTIVIQSASGSSSIFYEGIRCATTELKTYAYGTAGGRFARMANPEWLYAGGSGALGYRSLLAKRYVCDEDGWARDTDEVLEKLVQLDPRRPRWVPRTPNEYSD